jgi:hypothetical protein
MVFLVRKGRTLSGWAERVGIGVSTDFLKAVSAKYVRLLPFPASVNAATADWVH